MKNKMFILPLLVFALSGCTINGDLNSKTSDSFSSANDEFASDNSNNTPDNEHKIKALLPELTTIDALTSKYNRNNRIKINLWTGFGSTMSSALNSIIEDFEKEYPYIEINHEQKGGYDKLHSTVMQSLNSRVYPNVIVGYPSHFADYIVNDIQYVLDDYIESSEYGIDLNDYNEQYMTENRSLMYKDEAKKQPYTMGIPFNKSTEVMVYNKTFFDAFGLEVPVTWDDAVALGKEIISIVKGTSDKLTKAEDKVNHFKTLWNYTYKDANDQDKTVTFDFQTVEEKDFYPLSYDSQANFFITMCNQFGGKYTEMGDTIEQGYMRFKGDAKVVEALNFIKSMNTQHVLGIPSTWNEPQYCSHEFKALKTLMLISSSAGITNNIAAGDKFEVGIAPIPYKTADKKFVISQGTNLAILKSDADHALASWLLIKFMTGATDYPARDSSGNYISIEYDEYDMPITTPVETREEATILNANVNFAIASGYFPVTKKGEQSDRYQEYISRERMMLSSSEKAKVDVQKMVSETYLKQNWNMFVDAAFVGSDEIRTGVNYIIPFMIITNYTAEEAIQYVYDRIH